MARRKRNVRDSDDDSDGGSQSADSDKTVNNSRHVSKKKATARKRGKTPVTSKKNAQQSQDDSDEDNATTRSNSPENASTDQSEVDSSDSNYDPNSTNKNKRKSKRTPLTDIKKQKLQKGTPRDTSPQPSTSYQVQNAINSDAQESDESDDVDSDYEHLIERSFEKLKIKHAAANQPQKAKKKIVKPGSSTGSQLSVNTSQTKTGSQSSVNTSQTKTGSQSSVNTSQMSASKKKKKIKKPDLSMDLKLVEQLAQKLVFFLLIEDHKKYAIRKKAIVTHVFTDEYSPKLYVAVLKKANETLKKVYGLEIMELTSLKDGYIIVNIQPFAQEIEEYIDVSKIKQQQRGLILFLLTVIYMNENVITEDELTRALKPLGIDLTSKQLHPVFGDVKKYITSELVKQMYLNYECISKDPPRYEFSWGERAKQECDKRDLLKFASNIMNTSPEDWKIQFQDAENCAEMPDPDAVTRARVMAMEPKRDAFFDSL